MSKSVLGPEAKIVAADIFVLRLRFNEVFQTSFARLEEKETVLVRLRDSEGYAGWGEAPAFQHPIYSTEWTGSVTSVLDQYLLPAVAAGAFSDVESVRRRFEWVRGHGIAKCAVEGAVWHILSSRAGIPLWRYWNGTCPSPEVGISIGGNDIDDVVAQVDSAVRAGYARVKVKIRPGLDINLVGSVRERFPKIRLAVDANEAYGRADFSLLARLDEFQLEMIEQPLAQDDLLGHAELSRKIRTPICLDEGISSIGLASAALQLGSCTIINIKPSRLGGYLAAMEVARLCSENGAGVWCGGMFESGIGKALNLHLSATEGFNLPGENSGTARYFQRDVLATPISVTAAGTVELPESPGLGWQVSEDAVDALSTISRSLQF